MAYAHDGQRVRSVATARAGDGSFLFLSRPALDFAITGGVAGYESLLGSTDVQSWVRAGYRLDVDVSEEDLAEAVALRGAIWHLVKAVLDDRALPPTASAVVNAAAQSGPITRQLGRSDRSDRGDWPDRSDWPGTDPAWHWHTPATLREVLSAVARDAIDLLAVEDRSRLRECAAGNCALIFYDDSRSGRRRWCAPQRCGDRTRARDYRSRQRAAP